jgi:peptidoglycan DL-endopeptidase CwlO
VTHRSPFRRPSAVSYRGRKWRAAILVAGVLSTLVAAPSAFAEPSSLASKEAEVQRVLGQIQGLDASLSQAVEAYNQATAKLDRIKSDLTVNTRRLTIARENLRRSQKLLAERLVAIYTSGEDQSTLAVLLGATSLDDFISRIDAVDRVSLQDVRVRDEVARFRREVQRRQARLKRARAAQEELVAERARHRASIENQLAERRRLVESIRNEIQRIKEEEARRQAELARQARERARQQAIETSFTQAVASDGSSESSEASSSESSDGSESMVESESSGSESSASESSGSESSAAAETTSPPPVSAPTRGGVVGIAMRYLGTPYQWGGSSPSTGFDCSGFVMYVFAQVGVSLPHNAAAQYGYGSPVSRSALQPGDIVFFNGLGHNGIYVGGGQFIHSPHTGDVVKISSLSGWYSSTYVGARRV